MLRFLLDLLSFYNHVKILALQEYQSGVGQFLLFLTLIFTIYCGIPHIIFYGYIKVSHIAI